MKKTFTGIVMVIVLISAGYTANAGEAEDGEKHSIEALFVLDTTGSMGGLIDAAKQKIWAIANTLAMSETAPEIKIGVMGFRDKQDAYVTKKIVMTDDIDHVFHNLMEFQADGGGDTPESVNQALHEAITEYDWSSDPKTYRVIFLFGDAPPHMDYEDVKYTRSAELAREKDIVINTIRCGNSPETKTHWTKIAASGSGMFFSLDQAGSAVLESSPYDTELADYSKKLDGTRIFYGGLDAIIERKIALEVEKDIYSKASDSAKASRAQFNASMSGAKNFSGKGELVHDVMMGKVKISEIDADLLPENMRDMTVKEREEHVDSAFSKRVDIQDQIETLGALRQEYIEDSINKFEIDKEGSLDHAIYQCIKAQAAKKGIIYEQGPVF
jgi:Mg-chelatase subunit ChlD/Arc/MetJ family transcription regulator